MDHPNDISNSNSTVRISEPNERLTACNDSLEFIEKMMKNICGSIKNEEKENSMSKETFNDLTDIVLYHNGFSNEERILLGNKLAECDAAPLLIQYINILTEYGIGYPLKGYKYECYEMLLIVCLNFTDSNPTFSIPLCENGIISMMLLTLKEFQNDVSENREKMNIAELAMTVLHNCADVTKNKKYFYDEPDMVEVLAWYAKHTSQEVNKDLALLSIITLAEIVEEKNNDVIIADDTIIQTILNLLGDSLTQPKRRAEGYSVTELISGLTRLANNKENSAIIVEHGILDYIRSILRTGDVIEKTAAAEAVWVLAFSNENKKKILDDNDLISALKAVTDPSEENKSPFARKLQLAASWALWVLYQPCEKKKKRHSNQQERMLCTIPLQRECAANLVEETDALRIQIDEEEQLDEALDFDQQPLGHVMISYQWECQKLMAKVKSQLENDGYKVWIDMEEMGGSTLQAMADAVENAAVVLISMSRKYKESKNCRTEAEYAYNCDVPIIPIKVEDGYKPDGWLGAIVGTKFYIDFVDCEKFEQVFKNLTREIGDRGKMIQASTVSLFDTPAPPPATEVTAENSTTDTSVKDWTRVDVKLWAKQNKIKQLKTKSLNGQVLLFLKQLRHDAPEFFYSYASDHLGLKNIQNLMTFSNAVEELQ